MPSHRLSIAFSVASSSAKPGIASARRGKPAGGLIGFKSEDDWFDYRLENDPRFLRRIEKARASLKAGRGVR